MKSLYYSLILFFVSGFSGLRSQDTLYDKYDAIYAGIYSSISMDGNFFTYDYFDSTSNSFESGGSQTMYNKTSITAGIKVSTRYFSFQYLFGFVNDWARREMSVSAFVPEFKSYGFSFYTKRMQNSFRYTSIKGTSYEGVNWDETLEIWRDTIFPLFTTKRYEADLNFYFNKDFSRGNLYSLLSFPRKKMGSLALKTGILYSDINNNGAAIIPVYGLGGYRWDHVNRMKFLAVHILPGWNMFRVQKYGTRKARLFIAGEIYFGPSLVWSKTEAADMRYADEKVSLRFGGFYNLRYGINTRHFLVELRGGFGVYNIKNLHSALTLTQLSGQMNIGYRIPFKKGYEKTEAVKTKLSGKVKK
jgi:hypothetical protein